MSKSLVCSFWLLQISVRIKQLSWRHNWGTSNSNQESQRKLKASPFLVRQRQRAISTYFYIYLYIRKLPLVFIHFTHHCSLPPQRGCLNFFFRTLWIQSLSWQLSELGLTRKLKYFPSSSYQETMCQTRWNQLSILGRFTTIPPMLREAMLTLTSHAPGSVNLGCSPKEQLPGKAGQDFHPALW